MARMIPIQYYDINDCEHEDEALVEYVTLHDTEGKVEHDITDIFLPEGVPLVDRREVREYVANLFYKGEGYEV